VAGGTDPFENVGFRVLVLKTFVRQGSISVSPHGKPGAESDVRVLEMVTGINEKRDIFEPLFLTEVAEEQLRESCCSRLERPNLAGSCRDRPQRTASAAVR
jgi:hypothetical protein